AKSYNVYMLGFLPGFAYMGEVDEKIATPRKSQPVNVAAGSVGIAGKQTGIYPLASPGGWQIIGRTPLKLFNAASLAPTLLSVGDLVQFYPINKSEFEKIKITESVG
ncbi:MAG: carboxyltransferase domain-containing protein, partial [Chitinophagaceae bacterium]